MSDQPYFEIEKRSDRVQILRATDRLKKILDEDLIQRIGVIWYDLVGACALIIDFSQTEYMSSAMFGKLISLDNKLKAAHGRMILCGVHPKIYEVFAITKLNAVFLMTANLDQALAAARAMGFE